MKKFITIGLVAALAPLSLAAPVEYRISQQTATARGSNQVFSNIATVESETDFENFTGRTNDVRGSFMFDREAKTGSGTLIINGKSIDTGVDLRDEDMRSKEWLGFDTNPEIRFETIRVLNYQQDVYRVRGNLTLKGVTKEVVARVTMKYTPANKVPSALQNVGFLGDVLAMSSKFSIKLSDFGIKHPAIDAGRVNDRLDITVKAIASTKFPGDK
jgi:polyisoprenoid-binding protein YceI